MKVMLPVRHVTSFFLLISLSVPQETEEEKNTVWKEEGISLHPIPPLPTSHYFASFHPVAQTDASLNRCNIPDY